MTTGTQIGGAQALFSALEQDRHTFCCTSSKVLLHVVTALKSFEKVASHNNDFFGSISHKIRNTF